MKVFLFSAAMLALVATPASAGSTTLKKGATTMKLWCNSGGCYTKTKKGGQRYGSNRTIGPGGSKNYRVNLKGFKAKGWR